MVAHENRFSVLALRLAAAARYLCALPGCRGAGNHTSAAGHTAQIERKDPCDWIVLFYFAFGEISVLRHDRQETFLQHKRDMEEIFGRFGGLHQDVLALQSNVSATQQARSLPADSLKRRALDLSNEILQFLIGREVPPGYGQGGFGEGPFGGKPSDTKAYDQETLSIFYNVFQPRVLSIHDDFKRKGMSDQQLDAEYAQPVKHIFN
jgi:hypothetical protein